jgi:hypothetical protein
MSLYYPNCEILDKVAQQKSLRRVSKRPDRGAGVYWRKCRAVAMLMCRLGSSLVCQFFDCQRMIIGLW